MLLKQMKYFVTIVRCHSFTEAAEELYISQSAISQQIKLLEEELGVSLLIRSHRSFELTPAGEHFYRHALSVLDEIERIKSETIQIGEYDDERLSIGVPHGFGQQEILKAIHEFSSLYPQVDIDVRTGTHEELYDLLRYKECDMILNDQRRAFNENYINYHLIHAKTYIEISKDNPLTSLDYLTIEDLRRLPLVIVAEKDQEVNEQEFYTKTLGYTNNIIFVRNVETARILISANKGYRPVESYRDRETLSYIPLQESNQPVTRHYCLFWKKEHTNYYIEEFAKIAYKYFNS